VLPDGLVSIGEGAFEGYPSNESIELPRLPDEPAR